MLGCQRYLTDDSISLSVYKCVGGILRHIFCFYKEGYVLLREPEKDGKERRITVDNAQYIKYNHEK